MIKQINKSSEPAAHHKNVSYRHAVIHVYLFILLLLIFLSCLAPWCAGSAVLLTLMLAALALVLVEAALDFKNKSVSLQLFSPLADSALRDFSLFLCTPPCVI